MKLYFYSHRWFYAAIISLVVFGMQYLFIIQPKLIKLHKLQKIAALLQQKLQLADKITQSAIAGMYYQQPIWTAELVQVARNLGLFVTVTDYYPSRQLLHVMMRGDTPTVLAYVQMLSQQNHVPILNFVVKLTAPNQLTLSMDIFLLNQTRPLLHWVKPQMMQHAFCMGKGFTPNNIAALTSVHTAQRVSLDWQNVNLPEAIRSLAKLANLNVVISASVQGIVNLHLQAVSPTQALEILLLSQNLASWRKANVWLIAPQTELIKRQQETVQWQEALTAAEPLTTQVWVMKYAKAEDVARVLQDEHAALLSKRGHVRVDMRTNALCIQDVAERIASAHQVVTRLDVPIKQIAIEARLANVDSDFEQALGVDFTVKQLVPGSQTIGRYSIALAKLADGASLDVKLSALENAGHAELISSPSLFTANQQPASIEAGEEVPYQEASESGGTAIAFKKAVLGLKVTPYLLPGKKVLLQLQINQDRPSAKLVLGMPTINTRQIITSVLAQNGQTIVLGGIYETNKERGERRLPFISKLPVVGALFADQHVIENKRELLIFVTPRVVE